MPPFVLYKLYRDGTATDLQEYLDADSALDARDRRRREHWTAEPVFVVADEDAPQRGWVEWETFV